MKESLIGFDMPHQHVAVDLHPVCLRKIQQRLRGVEMNRDGRFIPGFPNQFPALFPVHHIVGFQFVFRRQNIELADHQILQPGV